MNEDKIKAKFFAMYLGQELCVTSIPENVNYPNYPFDINEGGLFLSGVLGNSIIVRRIAEDVKDRFNQTSLLLRSVSQLTDDELITMASIVCARHNRHYEAKDISYKISQKRRYDIFLIVKGVARYTVQLDSDGIGFVDYYMGGAGTINHYAPAQFAATDYLRSIGILLPYTYLDENNKPITLQPDEIIAKEWVKIKAY